MRPYARISSAAKHYLVDSSRLTQGSLLNGQVRRCMVLRQKRFNLTIYY